MAAGDSFNSAKEERQMSNLNLQYSIKCQSQIPNSVEKERNTRQKIKKERKITNRHKIKNLSNPLIIKSIKNETLTKLEKITFKVNKFKEIKTSKTLGKNNNKNTLLDSSKKSIQEIEDYLLELNCAA